MSTQTIYGPVHLDVYSKGRKQGMGIIGHGSVGPPEPWSNSITYCLDLETNIQRSKQYGLQVCVEKLLISNNSIEKLNFN